MKLDLKLCRLILLKVQDTLSLGRGIPSSQLASMLGIDPHEVAYHCDIMIEGGLLQTAFPQITGDVPDPFVGRLTWSGHDFVDLTADENRLSKVQEALNKVGGGTLQVAMNILTTLATRAAEAALGLS